MPRRRQPEQELHKVVAAYLDLALPRDAFWFHPPNGGRRFGIEGAIFKGLGVKSGVPDIIIIQAGRVFCIELKAGPSRGLTERQRQVHNRLMRAGANVQTCRSLPEVEEFLSYFMALAGRTKISPAQRSKPLDNYPNAAMVDGT